MFIIFGSPRSGTTLLKESLNLHSDLFIPMETSIIGTAAHIASTVTSWDKARPIIANTLIASNDYATSFAAHLSEAEIWEIAENAPPSLAGLLDALYGTLGSKLGKRLCGDKSPNDLLSIRKLEEVGLLDSELKFVHIVRDVRGSVASLLNVDWAPPRIEEFFPRIWNYTNLHLFNALRGKSNYLLIKYEDLIGNPAATLARITDLLGVPFQSAMLESNERGKELRATPSHRNLAMPFLTDRIDAWRKNLPSEIAAHCEYSAREAMSIFGYK